MFLTLIRPNLSLSSIEVAPRFLVIKFKYPEKCADGSTRARARGARALNSAHKRAVNVRSIRLLAPHRKSVRITAHDYLRLCAKVSPRA